MALASEPPGPAADAPQGSDANEPWTIRRVLTWAGADLRKRGSASPRLDAELLLGLVLELDRIRLITDAERPLTSDELARYRSLHLRRRAGEPVAYLRGTREFFGRPFRVDARVLVPRPETEFLVEVGLERTKDLYLCSRVLDLCTGSGCVAITVARERPSAFVVAADISASALALAQENAVRLGAFNVSFALSDLFQGIPEAARFDLITANPPYIADAEIEGLDADVRDFEPRIALSGGADGFDTIRRLVREAPAHLERGGVFALEVGAGQADETCELLRRSGFSMIEKRRDYAGHERIVSGVHRKTEGDV